VPKALQEWHLPTSWENLAPQAVHSNTEGWRAMRIPHASKRYDDT
jgi:hypothetical protein